MAETERESVGGRQSGGDGAEYAQTKPLRVRLDVDDVLWEYEKVKGRKIEHICKCVVLV